MKTKEIRQYLEKYLLPFFEQHGFVLSTVNEFGYEISKEVDRVLYKCTCTKLKSSNAIYFEAFAMSISFGDVEKVLADLIPKYELDEEFYTLRSYDNEDATVENRRKVSSVMIETEADFAQYAEAVKRYCTEVVFPFFDRYNSVEALNGLIKEIPEDDLGYHLGGEFQLKKMIVLKYCNDPQYDTYADYVRQKFESIKDLDDGKYMPLLNAYYELAERLKKELK